MMLKSPILFTNAYGSHRARCDCTAPQPPVELSADMVVFQHVWICYFQSRTILRRSAPATEVRPAALSEELAPLKEASTSMTAPTTSQRQFGGQERASG